MAEKVLPYNDQGYTIGDDAAALVGFHGEAVDQAAAIDDISVTGTYADDDTPIETAINAILAALRDKGIIASS